MPYDAAKNAWATSPAIADLTDNSGGTADDTIAAITGDASVVDAVADLTAKVNAILAALRDAGIIVS